MKKATRWLIAVLMVTALGTGERGRAQSDARAMAAEPEIKRTLGKFLVAFDNLDWPSFRQFFSPDVTMFHPSAPNQKRIDSAEEFERAWLGVFARIQKSSGRSSAPYMHLEPQDLKIQMLSHGVALVTFHLTDANVLSRRTIVFRHDGDGWKIVHIHASNLALSPP
jgi:ketosteroid isomerase-like protein